MYGAGQRLARKFFCPVGGLEDHRNDDGGGLHQVGFGGVFVNVHVGVVLHGAAIERVPDELEAG